MENEEILTNEGIETTDEELACVDDEGAGIAPLLAVGAGVMIGVVAPKIYNRVLKPIGRGVKGLLHRKSKKAKDGVIEVEFEEVEDEKAEENSDEEK